MENLQKKYGFWTATAMVVGIVIGSGVFFKADDVLVASGGSLPTALFAWFMTFVYYPTLVAVLAWVSANYTAGLLGAEQSVWPVAVVYLVVFFCLNCCSPVLAARWQVSSTIIKMVPLALVAAVGSFCGLMNGQTLESFTHAAQTVSSGGGLAVATLSTAFV